MTTRRLACIGVGTAALCCAIPSGWPGAPSQSGWHNLIACRGGQTRKQGSDGLSGTKPRSGRATGKRKRPRPQSTSKPTPDESDDDIQISRVAGRGSSATRPGREGQKYVTAPLEEQWEDSEEAEEWDHATADGLDDSEEGPRSAPRYRGSMGRGPSGRRPPMFNPAAVRQRLSGATEDLRVKVDGARHKATKVVRELKGSLSSDLEKTLLKATRPDNDPAKRKHVQLLLKATEHFPMYMDPRDSSEAVREKPYWMTLRKLWRRATEKDWRTACKALYVLHRLAKDTTPESAAYFKDTFRDMRRELDGKSGNKYFSRRAIRGLGEGGDLYEAWLRSYAEFVLLRLHHFSPHFEEVKPGGSGGKALERAQKLISAGLECGLGRDLDNDVTYGCLELVTEDLVELWGLVGAALGQQLARGTPSDQEQAERTAQACERYVEQEPEVRKFLKTAHAVLSHYSDALPKQLPEAPFTTSQLQEYLAKVRPS